MFIYNKLLIGTIYSRNMKTAKTKNSYSENMS